MKKIKLLIKILALTSVLFISCSENEPNAEDVCTSENYTVNFDRYVNEIQETPTNIGQLGSTTEITYNQYNLLSSIYSYNIDNQNRNNINYKCNNNVSSMFQNEYTYNLENKLINSNSDSNPSTSYSLIYNGNIITVKGMLEENLYNDITLELNANNLVSKISRASNYSILEYDANNNLVKATDFDLNDTLLSSIKINYDQKRNPFNGHLSSVYIDRILRYFNKSAEDGFTELAFNSLLETHFPYFKNNILTIHRTTEDLVNEEILKRNFTYDNNNYPTKFEFITVGYHDSTVKIIYQ